MKKIIKPAVTVLIGIPALIALGTLIAKGITTYVLFIWNLI